MKKFISTSLAIAALCLGAISSLAWGQIVVYDGLDPGVGPGGARPASDAAAAAFDAAVVVNTIVDFESSPIGDFDDLEIAGCGTVSLVNTLADIDGGITNVLGGTILGYNTTLGGTNHLRVVPPFGIGSTDVTFIFDTPVYAWGAYITATGTVAFTAIDLLFDDGSSQSLTIPGSSTGGVSFFGFTDVGTSIAAVTVRETLSGDGRDIYGIDDVRCIDTYPLAIDHKPGSNPNCVNPGSRGRTAVAILGEDDFDALTIDESTVVFGGADPVRCSVEDANFDGLLDLVCHFKVQEVTYPAPGSDCDTMTLTASSFDGLDYQGTDTTCLSGEPVCDAGTPQP